MNRQLAGADDIAGTYLFDLRASAKALRLNRFFWGLTHANARDRFAADPEATMRDAGLSDVEMELVRARDWLGLVRYGANFFVLEKFARVVRMSNLEVYAEMRGETFDAFMQTRRVPGAR